MVRIHPAPGTGRRWASEIEITGIEGKVAKTTWCSGRSRPVERSDEWCGLAGKQGKWIVIEVKVQQIEIVSPLANLLEHGHVRRSGCGRGSIHRGNEIVRGNSFRTAQSARKLLPFSSSEGSVLIFILLRRVRHVRVLSLLVEPHFDSRC